MHSNFEFISNRKNVMNVKIIEIDVIDKLI